MNASPSTKANTNGNLDFMRSLKSCVPAVTPVTAYSAFGSFSATGGITSLRSTSRACKDALSSPLPAIENSTRATVLSGLTKTWNGR